MTTKYNRFSIGAYRPIYLWGGPGTIRMNRLKFMNQPVDRAAHNEVHNEIGARRVIESLHCNWIHLAYNWGFPPEIESTDWDEFAKAAKIYHRLGEKVFAYIQTSNCVYQGSYLEKDWYARDPKGKKIYYYSGRYMACLMNPVWRSHLKEMIQGAIERGADGIFFDNLWHGAMPISLTGSWLGAAGCHCARCQKQFLDVKGVPIPHEINPEDPVSRAYIQYRADQVTELIKELAEYARRIQPSVVISANDYDPIMRSSYIVYGIDLPQLANFQDIVMIENFALPKWSAGSRPRLANNALTVRNALPLVGNRHLSVLSYDLLIGLDAPYEPRRYKQGIAEAAALGASMTTKGTEYFYEGEHTVLTPVQFAHVHRVIKTFNRWLDKNQERYQGRKNNAPVGFLFPDDELWLSWHRLSQIYFGAALALLYKGIPWKVITAETDDPDVGVILTFGKTSDRLAKEMQIDVQSIPGWQLKPKSRTARNRFLRSPVSALTHRVNKAYFSSPLARRVMDRLGVPKLYSQTTLFFLPEQERIQSLIDAIQTDIYPRVDAKEPVLIDVWRRNDIHQVHLVNYASSTQTVKVSFDTHVTARAISPDFPGERLYSGSSIELPINIYTVLLVQI